MSPFPFQILSTPPSLPLLPCHLHIWCAILLNDNIDMYVSSLGTLVPEGPWYLFYATRCQFYWGLAYNVVFQWYSDLISHTHKHKNTQHTQEALDWHTHVNICLYHLLCAHTAAAFITLMVKWIIRWYQNFTFHNVVSCQ